MSAIYAALRLCNLIARMCSVYMIPLVNAITKSAYSHKDTSISSKTIHI